MLKHEAKLIDPTADEIVAALTETAAVANKRCRARLLTDDPAKWRKFARDTTAEPEGWEMFRGGKGGVPATQVLAAWWTDSIGRKHVVLRGRRVEHDEAKRLLQKDELEKRPPLWHAYPEYVCRRTTGEESQIVCACGCGAVGTPGSLGWMGETCGPCFDRKEEVGAGALSANLPGVLYGDRELLGSVACSPDGTRVAAVEGDSCVTYWDIPARTRTVLKFSDAQTTDVAITSDGRHLLVSGLRRLDFYHGIFAAFDVTTDPPTRVDPVNEDIPSAWGVLALHEPDLAILLCSVSLGSRCQAVVVRVRTGEIVRRVDLPSDSLGPLSLSPDGTQLAIGASRLRVFDLRSGTAVFDALATAMGTKGVGYSPDGQRIFIEARGGLEARDATNGNTLYTEWQNNPPTTVDGTATRIAVDPTGEFVFAATNHNKLCVFNAGTLKRKAVFDWHLGSVRGLAVSANGSRLFSSGNDGCVKVWPIRDLLRGV